MVPTRLGRALAAVLALMLLNGCYTRLTHPKSAFVTYTDNDGQPLPSQTARAILAPDYSRILRARGADRPEVYRLQPGTRVRVEVYGQGIDQTLNIRPDGVIDLPLIGDVQAVGQTIEEFKADVSGRYAEYFVEAPQVILNTESTENDSRVLAGNVSILNPTGNQGVVNLTGDERLSEVLAASGALHKKSEWNEIAVIREGQAVKERYIVICDLEKLIRYGDLDQDIRMRNGDIVFIPFEKNTLLEEIFASIGVLASLASDADTITGYVDFVEGF